MNIFLHFGIRYHLNVLCFLILLYFFCEAACSEMVIWFKIMNKWLICYWTSIRVRNPVWPPLEPVSLTALMHEQKITEIPDKPPINAVLFFCLGERIYKSDSILFLSQHCPWRTVCKHNSLELFLLCKNYCELFSSASFPPQFFVTSGLYLTVDWQDPERRYRGGGTQPSVVDWHLTTSWKPFPLWNMEMKGFLYLTLNTGLFLFLDYFIHLNPP